MTREEAKRRRQQLAAAVRAKQTVEQVAEKFHVTPRLVRTACEEFEVAVHRPSRKTKIAERDRVVAELRVGRPPAEVAQQNGLSPKRLAKIQESMVDGAPSTRRHTKKLV